MSNLPQRIGKYDVRGLLGAGAMAVVYQAYDPVIERTIAIKVVDKTRLDSEEAESVLGRFRIEARAAGRLQHPNIVAVYDFGEEGNLVYLAMECVFGRPLTVYLQAEDFRGEPEKVCEVMRQILAALGCSHGQGVVHRDVKPANIMVNREGVIKVTDFGVARIESSRLTQTGDLIGTPSYMSPEQFAGETADARTDLYAASVIFYELLTRKRPFEGSTNAVIMHRVFTETPAAPSVVNPLLSGALDAIVLKGLAKDAADRFQSAQEYDAAIVAAMRGPLLREAAAAAGPARIEHAPPAGPPAAGTGARIASHLLRAVRAGRPAAEPAGGVSPGTATTGLAGAPRPSGGLSSDDVTVLFVDDEARILNALGALFRSRYRVLTAEDPRRALEILKDVHVHVLVSDQRMPHMLGVDLLRQAREISPQTVRILLTGYSDLASIVGSINQGEVWRFISKPWDANEIQATLAEAAAIARDMPEVPAWRMPAPPRHEESILVLDPAGAYLRTVVDMFNGEHWVVPARSVDEALGLLQERETAVLVVDLDTGQTEAKTLLHLLKREYPQILSIALTEASDAELLIELINEAQVYRFITKPVNPATLEQHVRAALNRYHSIKATPELVRAQTVVTPAHGLPAAGTRLLERLRALRPRFGFSR
jgi:serine/threonine-protein kinase